MAAGAHELSSRSLGWSRDKGVLRKAEQMNVGLIGHSYVTDIERSLRWANESE
jgi:hypothetical protein